MVGSPLSRTQAGSHRARTGKGKELHPRQFRHRGRHRLWNIGRLLSLLSGWRTGRVVENNVWLNRFFMTFQLYQDTIVRQHMHKCLRCVSTITFFQQTWWQTRPQSWLTNKCHTFLSCLSVRSLLQTKLLCYKLTKATSCIQDDFCSWNKNWSGLRPSV
jgi:hypothetical protein